MHVGDGCHAVPRATVGRDWMCRIIPLARVCRASNLNDSVTVILNKVMRRAAYFVSIQSKDLTHSPTRFFATEAQNDKPIPRSPLPVPCSLFAAATPSRMWFNLETWQYKILEQADQFPARNDGS